MSKVNQRSGDELVSPIKLAKAIGRRPQVIYALLRKHPELVHEVKGKKMVYEREILSVLGAPRKPGRRSNADEDFNLPTGFVLEGVWVHANIWVFPDETKRPKWVRGKEASGKEVSLSRRRLYKLIKSGALQPVDVDALLEALLELKKNHPDTYNKSYQSWKGLKQELGLQDPEEEELL